jgi:hypothetical protein
LREIMRDERRFMKGHRLAEDGVPALRRALSVAYCMRNRAAMVRLTAMHPLPCVQVAATDESMLTASDCAATKR